MPRQTGSMQSSIHPGLWVLPWRKWKVCTIRKYKCFHEKRWSNAPAGLNMPEMKMWYSLQGEIPWSQQLMLTCACVQWKWVSLQSSCMVLPYHLPYADLRACRTTGSGKPLLFPIHIPAAGERASYRKPLMILFFRILSMACIPLFSLISIKKRGI